MTPRSAHRPSYQSPASLEALGDRVDPIERRHAAHETAAGLVRAGHESDEPELTRRLVTVVDEIGLPALADLWEDCPARSLPGALYRLYLLREWLRADPEAAATAWAAGRSTTRGPAPTEVYRVADEILHGAFTGDLAQALARAAACCVTIAAGRARRAVDAGERERAARMATIGDDLAAAAGLQEAGRLQ